MSLTNSARITAATAATTALGGLATTLHGAINDSPARAIGGVGLTMTGLTTIALILIRRWVTDISDDRQALAAAQCEAQQERSSYFALKAALENEQGRLSQDLATERRDLEARLVAERQAMADDFEAKRGNLIAETMEAAVLMMCNGEFAPAATSQGKLIRFPHPERAEARERARGHNVVGP